MYSCGPLHMDEQRQDDQLAPIYISSGPMQDIDLKTYRERWTIETGGGRRSGRSMLEMRHDDDNDDNYLQWIIIYYLKLYNSAQTNYYY